AVGLEKYFKSGKVPKGGKKYASSEFTAAFPLNAEKASGSALISQEVSDAVAVWLNKTEKVKDVRKTEGGPQDTFVWLIRTPRGVISPVARKAGKQVFFSYSPFAR